MTVENDNYIENNDTNNNDSSNEIIMKTIKIMLMMLTIY